MQKTTELVTWSGWTVSKKIEKKIPGYTVFTNIFENRYKEEGL